MSKLNEFKIKIQDKTNQWYENFDHKTGYIIWKVFRVLSWVLTLIIIPFLPLLIAMTGYSIDTGLYDALSTQWGLIVFIIVMITLVASLFTLWWFSRFGDYKEQNENK